MNHSQSKALKVQLQILAKELTEECSNINQGGCAVMAAIIGKELQSLGVQLDIVTPAHRRRYSPFNARKKLSQNNDNSVSDWEYEGVSFGHLAVRFSLGKRLWTWDSGGLKLGGTTYGDHRCWIAKYPFGHGMTVAECKIIAGTKEEWNKSFDRNKILPLRRIIKIISKLFGKILN
jgi:hypothetical protein